MLHEMRSPRGLSGALFTHRDTHTLPFIWAGPLTSTEKGFFQGCLAANCWVDWRAAQMKEKPARTFPPSPSLPLSPFRALGRPQASAPLPSFLCPQRPIGQMQPPPLPVGLARGQLDPRPPNHLLLLLPASGCQVSGWLGSMKQSIVRLR